MDAATTDWSDARAPWADLYHVYPDDARLCAALGLAHDVDAPHAEWVSLGEHVHQYESGRGYRVGVKMFCCPAHFWRFTVTTSEGKRYEMTSGSGSLAQYWPAVKQVAEGMFTITPLPAEAQP